MPAAMGGESVSEWSVPRYQRCVSTSGGGQLAVVRQRPSFNVVRRRSCLGRRRWRLEVSVEEGDQVGELLIEGWIGVCPVRLEGVHVVFAAVVPGADDELLRHVAGQVAAECTVGGCGVQPAGRTSIGTPAALIVFNRP